MQLVCRIAQNYVIIQGLKRLSKPLAESNHFIKRKEITYLVIIFCLTDYSWFVFYEGTTGAGITYGLWAKGCYFDTQRALEFYTETIYT